MIMASNKNPKSPFGNLREKTVKIIEKEFKGSSPLRDFPYTTRKNKRGNVIFVRECPRRFLASPYKGCEHGCAYCYTYTWLWTPPKGSVIVYTNYVEKVLQQISRLRLVPPLYLSPDTDVFQPQVENKYKITERLLNELMRRNIPFTVITRSTLIEKVFRNLYDYDLWFWQMSLTPLNERELKYIEPRAPSIKEKLKIVEKSVNFGIQTTIRIDPILPGLTDDLEKLEKLIEKASEIGVSHILTSIVDLDFRKQIWNRMRNLFLKLGREDVVTLWENLFFKKGINYGGYRHANPDYRRKLFLRIRDICTKNNLTFGTCQENMKELMTSRICEGVALPLAKRQGARFIPLDGCTADCQLCTFAIHSLPCCTPELRERADISLRKFMNVLKRKKEKQRNLRAYLASEYQIK